MLQDISKISTEEKKKNEYALNQFRYSFLAGNFEQLEELLHPKGKFFNGMNKTRALARFHKFLYSGERITQKMWTEFKDGYSLDENPGEHVIEFRYMEIDPFTNPEVDQFEFGSAPRKAYQEIVIRFAFCFRNGKIVRLRIPKKVIANIQHLVNQN